MIGKEASSDPFLPALFEAEARPVRVTKLEIVHGSASSQIGAQGALAVFIAKKGSEILDDVRRAAMGDSSSAQRLLERLKSQQTSEQERPLSDHDYVQMLIRAPVFAHFRYGGDVLNRGIFLPEGEELVATIFPYNGGRLASGGCSLAEYYQEGSDLALEGLAVQIPPPLTTAEKAALIKVPADQRPHNIGLPLSCAHTTYWIAAGAGAVGFTIGTGLTVAAILVVAAFQAEAVSDHLSNEDLAHLDPSASARKLLALRRKLLLQHFSQ